MDAATAVKEFVEEGFRTAVKESVEEGFRTGEVTAIISLDVEGAFNSAWWPSILGVWVPPEPI